MVEKPFGTDLASSRQLNDTMHQYFPEDAIFRVDDWLAFDPVENVLFVRFANSMIEPLLNRNYVEQHPDHDGRGVRRRRPRPVLRPDRRHPGRGPEPHAPGAGHRAGRTAGRPGPGRLAGRQVAGDLRAAAADPEDTVRGQYEGYHEVDGVDPKSTTESYVAVRLAADTWRWAGVPILIRAGKCMPVTATEIDIRFKRPPHDVFGIEPFAVATRCGSGSGRRPRSA